MPYTSLLLQVSSVVNELGLRARGSIGDATERPSLERHGRSVTSARTTQCKWWSWPGSNRRPPGCKPGALPAELQPRGMVGLSGFEPLTSRLSAVRSSQLSYRPVENRLRQTPRGNGTLVFREERVAFGRVAP
jgi:hypothetical protein